MVLFSTRMSSSGRSRSRSAWVCAENMPLKVLGLPLVPPPQVRDLGPARRDDFHIRAVVCRRTSTLHPHDLFSLPASAEMVTGVYSY